MSIANIKSAFDAYKKIENIIPDSKIERTSKTEETKGFGQMLNDALKEVDGLQKTADRQVEDLIVGKGTTTPHEAMIALEKADVAFQLMNTVRSKIIRAYEEVIRAQV